MGVEEMMEHGEWWEWSRRITDARGVDQVERIQKELREKYPEPLDQGGLMEMAEMKLAALKVGIT